MNSYYIQRITLVLLAACQLWTPARAQAPDRSGFGVAKVDLDVTSRSVSPEFYTGLAITVRKPTLPVERKKKLSLIDAVANAFGGRKEDKRTILVELKVTSGDVVLGQYTLLAYEFDRKANSVSTAVNGDLYLPLKRLGPAETIRVDLIYKDVQHAEYDFAAASKAMAELIPGNILINAVTKPFVAKIAGVASAVLGGSASGATMSAYSGALAPYADKSKHMTIYLVAPDGSELGDVQFSLIVTPTLLRPAADIATPMLNELKFADGEDPAALTYQLAGTSKSFLDELRVLPTFVKLAQDRSLAAVSNHCTTGRDLLSNRFELGLMDRASLLEASLVEAGFGDLVADTAWFYACFNAAEKSSLAVSRGQNPPPPRPLQPEVIDRAVLYAFGCWMTNQAGPSCAAASPEPAKTLDAKLGESVDMLVDSAFLPPETLEGGAQLKARVIAALKNTATRFSCFSRGMLIQRGDDGRVFRLEGVIEASKITRLQIRPVAAAELQCVG